MGLVIGKNENTRTNTRTVRKQNVVSTTIYTSILRQLDLYPVSSLKKSLNASKLSEHPLDREENCQHIWFGTSAAKTESLYGI